MAGLAATLRRGRLAAEALMVDTFTLSHYTGRGYDPVAQGEADQFTALGTSAGKLQNHVGPTRGEVGGRSLVNVRNELHLPIDAPALTAGDVATLTTLGPDTPASLLNTRWRVVAPIGKTWATAARYEVEEL